MHLSALIIALTAFMASHVASAPTPVVPEIQARSDTVVQFDAAKRDDTTEPVNVCGKYKDAEPVQYWEKRQTTEPVDIWGKHEDAEPIGEWEKRQTETTEPVDVWGKEQTEE